MVLGEFLKEIKKNPSSVKFAEMANILVIHCQTTGAYDGPAATATSAEAARALVGAQTRSRWPRAGAVVCPCGREIQLLHHCLGPCAWSDPAVRSGDPLAGKLGISL